MSTISLSHITKSFGRHKVIAVNDVTLEIPSDHFVVLLGPSGCGKSTTLRMIAGLEKPDQGEIRINDRVVNEVPPHGQKYKGVLPMLAERLVSGSY